MLRASLYIIACSARNRVVRRLRRLREPRYLIGAVVGGAYMYFAVFARISRARRGGSGGRSPVWPEGGLLMLHAVGPALAGAGLLVRAG